MSTHRKSIIRQAIDRLDEHMAIGESRREAKQAQRAAGEHIWTFSTGKIHSYKTRTTYQEHILRFVNWSRATYAIKSLEQLDDRANELASLYLQQELVTHKSAYTLQVERSALRLFFADRALARDVTLPRRVRTTIKRSRGPVAHDRHFQPANWQPLIKFEQACGLCRSELVRLMVADVYYNALGQLVIHVLNGKGDKEREVPALPGHEQDLLALTAERKLEESIFDHIPKHMDVHAYRREYAQALYLSLTDRQLPPADGRLRHSDYDLAAVQRVSWALGHNRLDVVLRHYLR
ncbi:MAG TPA: integrase [Ktedonobacteraceae bacterium]